jgi:small subunit ribosomal protein S20
MANHASAKKRAKQNPKRAKINTARRSRIKTFIKKIEAAVAAGDAEAAAAAFKAAQPEIMRGVSKGVIAKKTASRKISRLSAKVKSSKTPAAKKAS